MLACRRLFLVYYLLSGLPVARPLWGRYAPFAVSALLLLTSRPWRRFGPSHPSLFQVLPQLPIPPLLRTWGVKRKI